MRIKVRFNDGTYKIIENVTMIDYLDSEEPKMVINGKYGLDIIKANEIEYVTIVLKKD